MARVIRGTKFRDYLAGTADDDVFYGYEGDDTFYASFGDDVYYGGSGIDTVEYLTAGSGIFVDLISGYGRDGDGGAESYFNIENIVGSLHDDEIRGSNFGNYLNGWSGNDKLYGYGGDDLLFGGSGNDKIYGGSGNDTIHGGNNDDTLFGDSGDDMLFGDEGHDTIYGGSGNDTIDGGAGVDTVSYLGSSGVSVSLMGQLAEHLTGSVISVDSLYNMENVTGSAFDDYIYGNSQKNILKGEGGDDVLGGQGNGDHLDGGAGIDTADYRFAETGVYADLSFSFSFTNDTYNSIENLEGSRHNDVLRGDGGASVIMGNVGNDIIDGAGGNDVLYGMFAFGTYGETSAVDADTFVFNHLGTSNQNQHDTIMDFQPGIDHIDLSNTPVTDFSDLFTPGDRFMEQVGTDILIHTSVAANTDILLKNVLLSSLSSGDFLF